MAALIFVGVVILILAIWFGVDWLITKGVIFFMAQLFNIHWETKFWAVFVMVFIVTGLLNRNNLKFKK
jgi:hypothetical protein